jgi:hypothetical protein
MLILITIIQIFNIMAWDNLITAIQAVITANGNNEITGTILKDLFVNNIVPQLGSTKFKGVATPTTAPGTPETDIFYLALESGVYANFGQSVNAEPCILQYSTTSSTWNKRKLGSLALRHTADISRDIASISEGGVNRTRFSDSDLKFASRIVTDGTTVAASTVRCTDFIKLNGATKVVASMVVSTVDVGMAFYDVNQTFISFVQFSGSTNYTIEEIDVPSGAIFLRTTYWRESSRIDGVPFYLKFMGVEDAYNSVKKSNLLGQLRLFTSNVGYVRVEDGILKFKKLYLIDGESGKRIFLTDGTNVYSSENSITLQNFDSLFISIEDFVNGGNNTEITVGRKIWTSLTDNNFSLGIAMDTTDTKLMYGEIFSNNDKNNIDTLKSDVEILKNSVEGSEILPTTGLLNTDTLVVGDSAGIFDIRFPNANNFVQKLTDEAEDYFKVSLNPDGGSNPAFWSLNDVPSSLRGQTLVLKVSIKSDVPETILLNTDGGAYSIQSSTDWVDKNINVVFGSTYNDMRLMFYKSSSTVFYLKNISLKSVGIATDVEKNTSDIADLKTQTQNVNELNIDKLPNYKYKTAVINNGGSASLVVGLHGDSWTHKTDQFSKYTTFIAQYLRNKYGNGGGGFYDFGASSGSQFMRSIDPADATDTRSGTINYTDEGSGAFGINCAHAEFTSGSSISLDVLTAHEKFVFHLLGGASYGTFRYRVDGGTWVTVDASTLARYQTLDVVVSDAVHLLEFEFLTGNCIFLGVDMQRTDGVRVHKLGNRGLRASDVNAVDADLWKAAVTALNMDVFTCLLGTNERSTSLLPATFKTNMQGIYSLVKDVNPYVDYAFIAPSNNRNSATYEMQEYSNELKDLASTLGEPFISLIPLFGSTEKLIAKGFFFDSVHPTIDGGKAIQEYICNKLLK